MGRVSKGQSELHFMYEEAIHRMSKVMTSLNVKIATKPRTSDPSVSADDMESEG